MGEGKEPQNLVELLQKLHKDGVKKEEYKTYIDQFLEFKARKLGIPLIGHFELTPLCNLDCKMCYVHLNKNQLQDAEILTIDQWKCLMEQAHEAGMIKADLTGGECLSYPGFDELYRFLVNMGVEVSVLTNGVLLDENRIRFFMENPPHTIQVSLYGSCDEAYEKVTGKRVFNLVYRNLQIAKNNNLPVSIAITPNRYMLDDAEALIHVADASGIPYRINSALVMPREETGRELQDLTIEEYLMIYKVQLDLEKRELRPNNPRGLPDEKKSGSMQYGIRCGAGRSGFHIDWKGNMCACANLPKISVDALTLGFSECWRQVHQMAMQYPIPMECEGCVYQDKCIQCLAIHDNSKNPGHCNPWICKRTKQLIAYGFMDAPHV